MQREGVLREPSSRATPPERGLGSARRFTRRHAWIAAGAYLAIGVLVFSAFPRSWTIGAAVIFGPFAGPAVRDWEHGLDWAWTLAPWALSVLAAGVLVQLVVAPSVGVRGKLRLLAWGAGWTGWFLSALLSYGVALE